MLNYTEPVIAGNQNMLQTESKKSKTIITIFAALATSIIAIDQISKALVRINIELGSYISVIGDFFGLTYYHNSGAAFGIFQNGTVILAIISAVFAIGCLLLFFKPNIIPQLNNTQGNIGLTLLFCGSVGNLIDRIFLGFVTDWIKLGPIPNFNIADSCVTIGVIVLIIFALLPELFKKDQHHA